MINVTPVVFDKYSATGVLHVHSTRSDGLGEPEEIVHAGLKAGLDYIAFNDHRNLKLMDEGWHGKLTNGLMTIIGTELQHINLRSHLLVYGVNSIDPTGHILDQLDAVLAMNGIAIVAHPFEKRPYIPGYTGQYSWEFGTEHPFSGVEVWNWMSAWKPGVNPLNGWWRYKNPDKRVVHPPTKTVNFWRKTGGALVGGADAHAHRVFGHEVFSYFMLFNRVRTHILLNKSFTEPSQFVEALKAGKCFVSNAIVGDASEYRSAIHNGELFINLPATASIYLNGKSYGLHDMGIVNLGKIKLPLYIEIHRNNRTWIAQGYADKRTS